MDYNGLFPYQIAYLAEHINLANLIYNRTQKSLNGLSIPYPPIKVEVNDSKSLYESVSSSLLPNEKCAMVLSNVENVNISEINEMKQFYYTKNLSERTDIDDEICIIQQNVRGWLARRHYNKLKQATEKLQNCINID